MQKRMERLMMLLLCVAMLIGLNQDCVYAAEPSTYYDDVPATHWAIAEINAAYNSGIMTGMAERSFGLGQRLNRASFLTMLVRMFGWESVSPQTACFSDCQPGIWYYDAVETAKAAGILSETEQIRPLEDITRMEMAQWLVRALGYETLAQSVESYGTAFADVSRSGYATIAYDIGMMTGVEKGGALHMLPDEPASREEACAMLMRVYERYTSHLEVVHGFYAFSSYSQISLTAQMTSLSLGWCRMQIGADGLPYVQTDSANGNPWVQPSDSRTALDYFDNHGVPYHLSVFSSTWDSITVENETSSTLAAILRAEQSQQAAVRAIVAQAEGYAGVTIDFEGLSNAADAERLNDFMRLLRAELPAEKTLYVCVMPDNYYTGYDFHTLGSLCDKVIMMAHDYAPTSLPEEYVGVRSANYPDAPIAEIYRALQAMTDVQTGVEDRSKIVLAVSLASIAYPVDENGILSSTDFGNSSTEIVARRLKLNKDAIRWSEEYMMPTVRYQIEDGSWYQVWYENGASIEAKLLLARMFGVNGVSLWRLGEIPVDEDVDIDYNVWETILSLQS